MKISRIFGLGLSALGVWLCPGNAVAAAGCSDSAPRDCWRDHGGSNYNLVDVAPGIACAVFISQLGVRFNDAFQCFRPSGAFNVSGVFPPRNMATVFGNTPTTRLKSISVAPTSGSVGPTVLWALRADGNLYQSTCNVAFRDGRDDLTDLTLLAGPRTNTGAAITLKQVTAVRGYMGPGLTTFPLAISTSKAAYVLLSVGWVRVDQTHSQFTAFGGTTGAMVMRGSSASSRTTELWWRTNGTTFGLPAIPSGVTLAQAFSGFFLGDIITQPFAVGRQDAWIVTTGINVDTFIQRSQLVNGTWTAWAPYPTAPFTDFDNPPTLPWSIVDAEEFRSPNRRGELMGIGDNYHLVSYLPP